MAPALPAIASYCATFLPREMLHVYRQVCGVRSFDHWVMTRRRANAAAFPFPQVVELRKSPWRIFNRCGIALSAISFPWAALKLRRCCGFARHRDVSLVHVYLGSEALRILSFLERFNGARVISFHGADLSDEFSAESYAPLWNRAELFLCRSQSLRERLLAKGCPADRVRLNYTGVPVPSEFAGRRLPDRRNAEPVRLLQACRFIQKKGLDATLHAIRLLKDKAVPVSLTLAGEGPKNLHFGPWPGNSASPIRSCSPASSNASNSRRLIAAIISSCTPAGRPPKAIAKASPTLFSKQWPMGCRSSRPGTAGFPKQSPMARTASSLNVPTRPHSRRRSDS